MNELKYNGISFNKEWVRSQSLAFFLKHESHHPLSPEQLTEIHQLCGGKQDAPKVVKKDIAPGKKPGSKDSSFSTEGDS